MASSRKICVGQFAGAHGVRGLVKLRSFTADPEALFDYSPLSTEDGERVFKIVLKSSAKDHFVVAVEGIAHKEDADQLRGDKIFIPRDSLPQTRKGEYYEGDLLGLKVMDSEGKDLGTVMGIHDHGAGVFLEIGHSRKTSFMLPFKDAFVPEVDLKMSKVTVIIPDGWL